MKKIIYRSLLLLFLVAIGTFRSSAILTDNYLESFNGPYTTTAHDFAPTGWGHIVDYLAYDGTSWGDDTYVTYTAKTSGGQSGAYISCGKQDLYNYDNSVVLTKSCNDMLVTPAVNGTVSFYVKGNATTGTVKLFKCTKSGTKFTAGDPIELTNFTMTTSWQKITLTITENTFIGIRLDNANIDEFSATKADIPEIYSLQITSATAITTSPVNADPNGNVTFKGLVKIKNTGNVTYNPGDANYTVSLVNYTGKAVLGTVTPTFSLAPNTESAEFEVSGVYTLPDPKVDGRIRVDVQENLSATTKMLGSVWYEIKAYAPQLTMIYNGTTYDGKVINLGVMRKTGELNVTLRSSGGAPLVITSATLPAGYSLTNITSFPYTLASNTEVVETIKIVGSEGLKENDIVFNFEGKGNNTIKTKGILIDENTYLEDFETGVIPIGWVLPSDSNWRINDVPTASAATNNKKCIYNSLLALSTITTPKLTFTEGQNLMFHAARQSASSVLNIYYSTDRTNWTKLSSVTTTTTDPNVFETTNGLFKSFSFPMEAGDYYIRFDAGYAYLDNIIGGTRKVVDHDILISKFETPISGMINNKINATLTLANLNTVAETAGSYKVALYANDVEVASKDGEAMASGETKTVVLGYTPHATGDVKLSAKVKMNQGSYEVIATNASSINVGEELALVEVTLGNPDKTGVSVPLRLGNKNTITEIIYTAEDLKIEKGAKIASISFPYYNTTKSITPNLGIWMANTSDATPDITNKAISDTTNMTQVYLGPKDLEKAGSSTNLVRWVINFDKPFVYNGGNLRMILRSECTSYSATYFGYDSSKTMNVLTRTSDSYSTYKTGTPTVATTYPVSYLSVTKDPTIVSGVITEKTKKLPIAGVEVKLVSGDVIYKATTDVEGKYSINVFQPNNTYSYSITRKGYATLSGSQFDLKAESFNYALSFTTEESKVTIKATSTIGASLAGIPVTLSNETYGLEYPAGTLNAQGECNFTGIVNGYNKLIIDGSSLGLERYVNEEFAVAGETVLNIELKEAMRTPYALTAKHDHDAHSGIDNVSLSWNKENDYFFDDFEGYDPFSINFTPWTGIDGDKEITAQIQGSYPNSQLAQYATIFNPLTIVPAVWYDYPVLRPYSGKQYVGIIRTASGVANNDWIISPKIKIGVNNIVSFMAKAADATKENFKVLISTTGTNMSDFVSLTPGNYQSVDYKAWKNISYDLSSYEGKEVYIAVQCVSKGAFMLMLDDFYVGPSKLSPNLIKARRISLRSADNPYEKFHVYLDDVKVAETEETSYVFENITSGTHKLSVKAVYRQGETETTDLSIDIPTSDKYCAVNFSVEANNKKATDGFAVNLVNVASGVQMSETVVNGKVSVPYIEKGQYIVNINQEGYDPISETCNFDGDVSKTLVLNETLTTPSNLTIETHAASDGSKRDVTLTWNQDLGFSDGFESYADFTQSPGDWTIIDGDKMPTYGISFNNTNVSIPGLAMNGLLGAMVFNPNTTQPSMVADGAILAPEGDKSILFLSAQSTKNDNWLISPKQKINSDYVLQFTGKSYLSDYLETIAVGILTDKNDLSTFVALDNITLPSNEWMRYELDLKDYEGKEVYVAFHHISYDSFIAQLDEVYVGPKAETSKVATQAVSNTNIVKYNVYLNGTKVADTTSNTYIFSALEEGSYTAAVEAVYATGVSEKSAIDFILKPSSINDNKAEGTNIYASEGAINVSTNVAAGIINIYNVAGSLVASVQISDTLTTIPVQEGVYVVEVKANDGRIVRKVLVK